MDYGRVLGRAWEIVWRWKVLWLLGFLAALGQGSSGSNSSNRLSEQDTANLPFLSGIPNLEGLLVGLGCLFLIFLLVIIVVSTIARGALIAGVAQVEDEGSTSFRRAWSVGRSYFWTLIGIFFLVLIPVILLVVAAIVGAALVGGGLDALAQGGGGAGMAGLLGCICPAICAIVLLVILLSAISTYAERAAVLENLGAVDALSRGWQVLRANLGPTVVLWVIFIVLSILIGVIALVISLPLLLPFAAIADSWSSNSPANLLLIPICGLGLIAFVLGALISSVVTAYTSAVWTLAYRQLTAPAAPPPLPPAPPEEPSLVTTVEP